MNECLEWAGARDRAGYGFIKVGGKMLKTHRVAWVIRNGPIPDGLHVCHRCDNPPYSNADHLFLGTPADNSRDMAAKGRTAAQIGVPGERNHYARLTDDTVREIRAAHRAGESQSALARRYGVGLSTVWHVVHRHTWRHVQDAEVSS